VCTDVCHDFAIARRNDKVHGPLFFALLPTPCCVHDGHVQRVSDLVRMLASGGGDEAQQQEGYEYVLDASRVTFADVEPPPEDGRLRAARVAFRADADRLVEDTLLVHPRSEWAAILVSDGSENALDNAPDNAILFGIPSSSLPNRSSRGPDSHIDSYLTRLAYHHLRGRRAFDAASPDDRDEAERLVRTWARLAEVHDMADDTLRLEPLRADVRLSRSQTRLDACPLSHLSLGPTKRSVACTTGASLLVRLVHDHGARLLRRSSVCEETGQAFLSVGRIAADVARENPHTAFRIYHDLYCDAMARQR
jgi:hypothetical protein